METQRFTVRVTIGEGIYTEQELAEEIADLLSSNLDFEKIEIIRPIDGEILVEVSLDE